MSKQLDAKLRVMTDLEPDHWDVTDEEDIEWISDFIDKCEDVGGEVEEGQAHSVLCKIGDEWERGPQGQTLPKDDSVLVATTHWDDGSRGIRIEMDGPGDDVRGLKPGFGFNDLRDSDAYRMDFDV